jgi:hypothetical protein
VKKAIAVRLIKSKTARRVAIKAAMNPRIRKIILDQARRRVMGR